LRPPKIKQSAIRTPLNRILGTVANIRLLRVLTLEPHPLSRQELGHRAGIEGSGAHITARRLEKEGILRRIGTGPRQQVKLELGHPLAAALQKLFREEQARVDRIVESLKRAAQNLAPDLDSAWIQGEFAEHTDNPGAAITMGVLARRGAKLPEITKALRATIASIEKREDVTVEIITFTNADLAVASQNQEKELKRAMPLFGLPPTILVEEFQGRQDWLLPATHSDKDKEQTLMAEKIANRLASNPEQVQAAKKWIHQRIATASQRERGALEEWLSLLDTMSPQRLARFLVDQGERATRLRQTLPFLNVLSEEERQEIIRSARGR
jgi:hypothetical protein